jgi:filamentous hemagglutinin family protein
MNQIYRTIWSVVNQAWQAVCEHSKTTGKKSVKSSRKGIVAAVALGSTLTGHVLAQGPPENIQLPAGAAVAQGTVTITQTATAQAAAMTVHQASQRAVVNWDSFNLGRSASVNFVQPNAQAVTLNRISDVNPSQIFGNITSNGQVILMNASGVYFSPTSSVDVGALIATTHSISNDKFMAGKYEFDRNGATGKIVNEGRINAAAGAYVALLAPEVQNAGIVTARAGTIVMAAGELVTLNVNNSGGLVGITTTPSAIASLIENRQMVQASDGQIILSAIALNKLQAGVIKNSGSLQANSLVNKGGKIYLEGDDITLAGTSKINATGPTGGGTVLVGGDWQGSGAMRQATKVVMQNGASIDASATTNGDGGKVVLWSDIRRSDSMTAVSGAIFARGGLQSGNGGAIETSGHQLSVDASMGDARAFQGKSGEWLLDPYNVTITTASANGAFTSSGADDTWAASANASTILNTAIQTRLESGTNVVVSTIGSGSDAGNIFVNSSIITGAMAADATLTLKASQNIAVAANVAIDATQNGNTKKLNVVLQSNIADATSGNVSLASGAAIKSNGGEIYIGGGSATTTSAAGNAVPLGNSLSSSSAGIALTAAALNAGSGDVTLKGQSGDAVSGVGVLLSGGTTVTAANVNLIGTGGNPTGGSTSAGAFTNTITATTGNALVQGGLFAPVSNSYLVSAPLGDVTLNARQTWKSGTLTLSAGRNIAINQDLDASPGGSLTVRFGQASADGAGSSYAVSSGTSILLPLTSSTTTNFKWKKGTGAVGSADNELLLNNGYLAFGSGTGGLATASNVASLSVSGQLNQPNYYDPGNSKWYKLTYSTNALNFQIGSGTGGSYWNGNAATFVSTGTSGVIDIGQYLPGIGGGPGGGTKASGVIKTTMSFTLAGASAKFINRYSLGTSDSYLRTDSSIAINTGSPSLVNAGLWVGTSDDYIGMSDSSYKTVGTVGSSGFVANTQTGQFANALRVDESSTGTTGASSLFYSIDASARATFAACCNFTNATSVNPAAQIAKSAATDGSYALYTGLGDIAAGGSKGFTWFYAAAPAATVNSVAQKVASTLTAYSFSSPQNLSVNYTGSSYTLSDLWSSMSINQGNNTFLTLFPDQTNPSYFNFTYNGNVATQFTNAGTYRLGISLSPNIASDYLLSSTYTPTLTITPASLSIAGSVAANKVYDGTTTASVIPGTLSGFIGAQTLGVSATGSFASANAGVRAVTPTYTLINGTNGGLASNYVIFNPPTLSATITPANLTLSGTKVYDGTQIVSGSQLVAKGVGTQTFTVTGSATSLASANLQTNVALGSVSGLSLGTSANGGLAANYNNLSVVGSSFSVTPKALTVTGTSVATKVYDGTTMASLNGGTLVGLIAGDTVNLIQGGAFATSAVGTGKAVTSLGSLSGVSASNYTLTQPTGLTGSITTRALTVSGTTVASRQYDGTTTASISGGSLVGVISGDTVTLTQSGAFANANVGVNKSVTATNSLGGTSAGNYSLIQPAGLTATITAKPLTVTGTSVGDKFYDSTTAATLTGGSLVGIVSGDTVTLTQTGMFASPQAGTNLAVTANNSLGGASAGNYLLTQPTGLSGSINPKPVMVSGLIVASKTYDGQVNASVANWGSISTGVGNETLSLGHGAAAFADASAGNAKTVTASGYTLADGANGGLARNYVLSSTTATAIADINKAVLTVIANNDGKFITQSDAQGFAGVRLSGFVSGENFGVVGGIANVSRSNSTQNNAGVYPGVLIPDVSGLTATNYSFSARNGDYTIVPANQLLIRVADVSTAYGAPTAYSISSAQYLSNSGAGNTIVDLTNSITSSGNNRFVIQDGVGGSAGFDIVASGGSSSSAGKLKVGSYSLTSSSVVTVNASNFSNVISVVGAQSVTAKSLTAQAIAGPSKTYDGTTDIVNLSLALNGVEGNDAVDVTGVGSYVAKNAGNNLPYTIANVFLQGADSSNYFMQANAVVTGNNGVIQKAPLTLTANNATKIYGDPNPVLSTTVSGFVNGENLATSGVSGAGAATTAATQATGAGTAVISAGIGTLAANNYDFATLVNGALTINKARLRIAANDATREVGQPNPILTTTMSGFVNGETLATSGVTGSSVAKTNATTSSPAGAVVIVAEVGTLASNNYDFLDLVNGILTIGAAPSNAADLAGIINKNYEDMNKPAGLPESSVPKLALTNAVFTAAGAKSSPVVGSNASTKISKVSPSSESLLPDTNKFSSPSQSGTLAVTFVEGAGPTATSINFEQKADMIALESPSVPVSQVTPVANDKTTFFGKLMTFIVVAPTGEAVEFQGGLVNNHIVIVAPSDQAKNVARDETKLVLASAMANLGKNDKLVLAQLAGVIIDLR